MEEEIDRNSFDKDMNDYMKERKNDSEYAFEKPAGMAPVQEYHEEKKPGFFSRLFGKKPVEEKVEEIIPLANTSQEDLKELSKITLKAIKMLSQRNLEIFKASEDFEKFKEILKRNNLIK